jgi:hypothetical protein
MKFVELFLVVLMFVVAQSAHHQFFGSSIYQPTRVVRRTTITRPIYGSNLGGFGNGLYGSRLY